MVTAGEAAPEIPGVVYGTPVLLFFFGAECTTCKLTASYLRALAGHGRTIGISQSSQAETEAFLREARLQIPVLLDEGLAISQRFDLPLVPALYLVDSAGQIMRSSILFDKQELNSIARSMGYRGELAGPYDGAPAAKAGSKSRHLDLPFTTAQAASY